MIAEKPLTSRLVFNRINNNKGYRKLVINIKVCNCEKLLLGKISVATTDEINDKQAYSNRFKHSDIIDKNRPILEMAPLSKE